MRRRLDAGAIIAFLGAALLLVSLFLAWYDGDQTAWEVFELVDLLLAALAIAGAAAALGMLVDLPSAPEPRWLGVSAAAAFVLVVAALLDRPPATGGDPDIGPWLALAGTALMGAGALLTVARVSISFDVAPRERRERVPAVVPPAATAAADPATRGGSLLGADERAEPTESTEPTEPLPPTQRTKKKGREPAE